MQEEVLEIWGHQIPMRLMSPADAEYLSRFKTAPPPPVEALWKEMDDIWHELALDNRAPLGSQRIADYYRHPVWILNGLYSASDEASLQHRRLIAEFVHSLGALRIGDYGGGFGQLAICLAEANPVASIEIIEPFPSAVGRSRIAHLPNVEISAALGTGYDVLVAQDVLEHVEDPIALALALTAAVKPDGHLIFANCFYGFIQCHLPRTFHLRHTFPFVLRAAGLRYLGPLPQAGHIQVFQKTGDVNVTAVRTRERISSVVGRVLNLREILR